MGEIDTQTAALAEKQKQAEEEGRRLADSADGITNALPPPARPGGRGRGASPRPWPPGRGVWQRAHAGAGPAGTGSAGGAGPLCRGTARARDRTEAALKAQADITAAQNPSTATVCAAARSGADRALQKQATDAGVRLDTVSSRLKLFQEMERELGAIPRCPHRHAGEPTRQAPRHPWRGVHAAAHTGQLHRCHRGRARQRHAEYRRGGRGAAPRLPSNI